MSSHALAEVAQSSDDVVIVAGGRLRAQGDLASVLGAESSLEDAFMTLTADSVEYSATTPAGVPA